MAERMRAGKSMDGLGTGAQAESHGRAAARWLGRQVAMALVMTAWAGGCASVPKLVAVDQRTTIDRQNIDYPGGFQFQPFIRNLTAPTAITFDDKGSILVAESPPGEEPTIIGFRTNGTSFTVYPQGRRFLLGLNDNLLGDWHMYGPVGGMVFYQGRLYISHRDANDNGVITALDYNGHHTTIIAGLPAQGEYGVTDLTIGSNGRLYFGIGTATNSGVVGLDDWEMGWARSHSDFHDVPYGPIDPNHQLQLLGFRFSSTNPLAGLFGPGEVAVTAPFQPFNNSDRTIVEPGPGQQDKPSGAICSVNPLGGDVRIEAYGIHNPRGLAVNEYGRLYFTDDGMEMRGTRPVKDDHDSLLRLVPGQPWYGWPDYSADLIPISDPIFRPPTDLIIGSGYPQVLFVIDHSASGLVAPGRDTLLQAAFPSLSGAAKLTFVPAGDPWQSFRGSAIICLDGDRAPFATSGRNLTGPIGYKVVRVDLDTDTHQVTDFIHNTAGVPRHLIPKKSPDLLERPIDAKFGPDGMLYILDFGEMTDKSGAEITGGTGQVFRLVPNPTDTFPTGPIGR